MQVYNDFPLSSVLYYKIGGNVKYLLKVHNRQDVIEALEFVKKNNLERVLPIGIGSNLLMNDKPFDGAVIFFEKNGESIKKTGENQLTAFSASLLDDLILFALENNQVGLEWAGGLPSTIGGAIRGNVGAFGGDIKKSVVTAEVIDVFDPSFSIKQLTNEDLQFGYRNSVVKQNKNLIVVSGTFELQKATPGEVQKAREEYLSHIQYRKDNHDMDYPSCGSVFKNIIDKEIVNRIVEKWPDIQDNVDNKWHGKVAMGYVNKRLGLSGFTVGGAQVSEKHGNYIINKKNAKFDDVLAIIKEVQKRVNQEFGFTPEPEVEIIE